MIKFLIRGLLIYTSLIITFPWVSAQDSRSHFNLDHGEFQVGFKNYVKRDHSRTYRRLYDWSHEIVSRPMSVSVWYPANKPSRRSQLQVKDFMKILKQEEEWESLPDERILSWFYYSDNEKNRKHLRLSTGCFKDAPPLKGKFPVVIYAPSYQASSVENFALCEFIASHGYIVLSSPSRGTESRFLDGGTTRDMETQARDIEFLIAEAATTENADIENLAAAGFSFGGISNVLASMRNDRIKALVCLDGTVKYQYKTLLSSPYANASTVDVPFIFMSQKEIPLSVMIEDKIDTTLNNNLAFFDSLKYSAAYYLKFHHLTHPYFSSMGVLFQERDKRQDKSDEEILASYKLVNAYTLNFLNAYLKKDRSAEMLLQRDPSGNGAGSGVISIRYKKPEIRSFNFEDFNELAKKQGYNNLGVLFERVKADHPPAHLAEWKMNNLGLQLLFQGKHREAINVLTLNTILYPNSANAFDSLGEGFFIQGDRELALKNYKLSLQLDPQNRNAIDRIKELTNN